MKLIDYFDEFLKNEVNLDAARLERLNSSVSAITNFLRDSPMFAGNFIDVIAQGSYAHKTIIKPVQANDEFDADILLFVQEFPDWSASDYVNNLNACFKGSGVYTAKALRQTRCVTIDYSGDFHVDVVPFLERHGHKYITNRRDQDYELTNPEGYNSWLDEKNRTTGRRLVKVIRLVKYLRDYKNTFGVKSVLLNVLLGDRVNDAALLVDPGCYADVPTTLRTVMNRLSSYVGQNPLLPAIMDPSGTGEDFSNRWNQEGYASFRNAIMRYASWIDDAWSEPDRALSLKKWQRVFGDAFQAPQPASSTKALVKASESSLVSFTNTEQKLGDVGIAEKLVPQYSVRINGRVTRKLGFRDFVMGQSGNKVQSGRTLEFSVARCTVPEPYEVRWKVKNNGPEARRRNMVRGQIESRGGARTITEPASFAGPHYVECYIIKNGICVAKDRQEVTII